MFMPIQINENSSEPLYAQIKHQLRALILSGHLEGGMLLPSIREFANQLQCSVITVRRVYQDLENDGLLRTKQGTGTFVAHVHVEERDRYRRHAVERALEEAVDAAIRVNISRGELEQLLQDVIHRKWNAEQAKSE
ncbi:GntR family transcriptional regulator [Aneurinibacillus aneurinilyticus]|uniref:GntR family transcriptional regulator n=1 Tax=Aneurinibacillus aneurinilyticus TaxID=1391 RepID=A0A848D292_ANEAE|nr:GntR family transcriptional regulator [Aneurinibacillus aneurinilyticus]MCI1695727.1 GntR family transcriptional regulator [Aneurinibacillus aneurinilyticus]MED0670714.1 GntR family transcriptional regulator [Aneurinibacillus aneurinilyticus]MED0706701.1 GntR family transcriptional regulator [Aneurinibacillus aneurinilyticus]MED0722575.1 GntR family transcriptional regulator [Aneurinibacillus aneurinilyticus]MED0734251.1 GntR family transcriptional regulator [Aneurinibacillus aneurinilyticu